MTGLWPERMGEDRSTKERRLGRPSISKGDGWEADIPWDL